MVEQKEERVESSVNNPSVVDLGMGYGDGYDNKGLRVGGTFDFADTHNRCGEKFILKRERRENDKQKGKKEKERKKRKKKTSIAVLLNNQYDQKDKQRYQKSCKGSRRRKYTYVRKAQ